MTANTDAEIEQAWLNGLYDYGMHMARTLRRMRNATVMPTGVSQDDLQDVLDAEYLRFVEGTYTGLYIITDAGHEFLREH